MRFQVAYRKIQSGFFGLYFSIIVIHVQVSIYFSKRATALTNPEFG